MVLPIIRLRLTLPVTLLLENVIAVMPDQPYRRLGTGSEASSRARVAGVRGGQFAVGFCEPEPGGDVQEDIREAFQGLDTVLQEGGSGLHELVSLRLFVGPGVGLDAVVGGVRHFLPEAVASTIMGVEGLTSAARFGILGIGLAD